MTRSPTLVIVGGSIAATTATDAARVAGHDGPIVVLSDEHYAPYVRPPLSKAVLKGTETAESTMMAPLPADVTLRTGARAVGLDVETRRVILADGGDVHYDRLLIATGARARRLSRHAGELVVRDLDDALAVRRHLLRARSALILGGGFLGMEIASTAVSMGLEVTVLDREPHLVRQFSRPLASHMVRVAAHHGVRLRQIDSDLELLGAAPDCGARDRMVTAVRTADGATYEADVVISAVGDQPNTEWLAGTGLAGPAGVPVDDRCMVRPGIAAAGDVAARLDSQGRYRRAPHWANAIDQARCAAAALVRGEEAPVYVPRPYFWTEQWGLDLKIAGELRPGAEMVVLEGSLEDNEALLQWTLHGEPVAAASMNRRVPIAKLHKLATAVPVA